MPVRFSYADRKLSFNRKTPLKSLLVEVARQEGRELGLLQYIFCSDEYLLDINRRFLNHDYYTDIITFDLNDGSDLVEGEIYISMDRVKENSSQLGVSFEDELVRVVLHGLLHLCGYRDKRKAEIALMRAAEDKYLRLYHKG